MRMAREKHRSDSQQCADGSGDKSTEKKQNIFRDYHFREMRGVITYGPQQGQLASSFHYIAEQNRRHSQGTKNQTEATQHLKRGKIGVFYAMKVCQPLRC